jgi:hypothetical protein
MYTEEGRKFTERLWNETLKELDFPEVQEVMATLRTSAV